LQIQVEQQLDCSASSLRNSIAAWRNHEKRVIGAT